MTTHWTLLCWIYSMASRTDVDVTGVDIQGTVTLRGIVNCIQAEDGSGRCFNVTVSTADGQRVLFVRL